MDHISLCLQRYEYKLLSNQLFLCFFCGLLGVYSGLLEPLFWLFVLQCVSIRSIINMLPYTHLSLCSFFYIIYYIVWPTNYWHAMVFMCYYPIHEFYFVENFVNPTVWHVACFYFVVLLCLLRTLRFRSRWECMLWIFKPLLLTIHG